jgi:hypothetical protein
MHRPRPPHPTKRRAPYQNFRAAALAPAPAPLHGPPLAPVTPPTKMVKLVHMETEGAHQSIRRARQRGMDAVKKAFKGASEDDRKRAEKEVRGQQSCSRSQGPAAPADQPGRWAGLGPSDQGRRSRSRARRRRIKAAESERIALSLRSPKPDHPSPCPNNPAPPTLPLQPRPAHPRGRRLRSRSCTTASSQRRSG